MAVREADLQFAATGSGAAAAERGREGRGGAGRREEELTGR